MKDSQHSNLINITSCPPIVQPPTTILQQPPQPQSPYPNTSNIPITQQHQSSSQQSLPTSQEINSILTSATTTKQKPPPVLLSNHQTKLNECNTTNLLIGDSIDTYDKTHTRLYFQNINGAYSGANWLRWSKAHEQLSQWNVSIIGTAETNVNWIGAKVNAAQHHIKKFFSSVCFATSSSVDSSPQAYQPGGTSTTITQGLTGRLIQRIYDKEYGRWSGFKLQGSNKKFLYIITCYKPKKDNNVGHNTCYQQQWRIMRGKNIHNPDPVKQLLSDLAKAITGWTSDGSNLILMWDANESIITYNNLLLQFMAKTKLFSLMSHNSEPGPNTYARGTKCIDYVFGTIGALECVKRKGFLPFYEGAWDSDHRALYIDFDTRALFGNTIQSVFIPPQRGVQSKDSKLIHKFLDSLHETNEINTLLQQVEELEAETSWTKYHHDKLEHIDKRFTTILTECDQTCIRKPGYAWSPELQTKYDIYKYWHLKQKSLLNKINTTLINDLRISINDDSALFHDHSPNEKSIKFHLQKSKAELNEARLTAIKLREQYLTTRQEFLISENKLSEASAIKQIRNAEKSKRCFQSFQKLQKPSRNSGGLSHVIVETEGEMIRIQDDQELQDTLIDKNSTHFSQGHNTPFTIDRLAQLFQFDGVTPTSKDLLDHGIVPPDISESSHDILTELKQVRLPLSNFMPFHDMLRGLNTWRETTTTSPSNKHLGIYKSLVLAFYLNIRSIKETEELVTSEKSLAHKALLIQHKLINIAIKQCHVYERWQVVHNFFLEKIPGYPLLTKLRVIHLYEADWNLVLKYFIAHKLVKQSNAENTLQPEQAGGRPGQSAESLAVKTVIAIEIGRLHQVTGAVMYNDAKACYDRIIENLSNLCCLREGLHPDIAKLHAKTLQLIKYYIKYKNGISSKYNQHNNPLPFLGSGQGAGDSGARWGYISDNLIRAYNKKSHKAELRSPISTRINNDKIQAFVDDTRLVIILPQESDEDIHQAIQKDTQLWENLLHAAGGKLELSKCKYTIFTWEYNQDGTAQLNDTITESSFLTLTDSETKLPMKVDQISSTTSYKLLGVQIAADGNPKGQILALKEKCVKFQQTFAQIQLDIEDVDLGYKCILTPSLNYGFAATNIDKDSLNSIQKHMHNTILPKLGYNRHFPRSVCYASQEFGGLGILDLYIEQGIAHILSLLSNIRAANDIGNLMLILLESYIIKTGMLGSPLQQTMTKNSFVSSPWIDTIRKFLRENNTTIHLTDLQTIKVIRENDKPIMELAVACQMSPSQLKQINNCRIYLQVMSIAEICNSDGTHILPCTLYGHKQLNGSSELNITSQSKLTWPFQPHPPQRSWKTWKIFLSKLIRPGSINTLKEHLGKWKSHCHDFRTWNYFCYGTDIYHRQNNVLTKGTTITNSTRKNVTVLLTASNDHININMCIPLTPAAIFPNSITYINQRGSNNFIKYDTPIAKWTTHLTMNTNHTTSYPVTKFIDTAQISLHYNVSQGYKSFHHWQIANTTEVLQVGSGQSPIGHSDPLVQRHAYAILSIITALINTYDKNQCPIPPHHIILWTHSTLFMQQFNKIRHNTNPTPQQCMQSEYELIFSIIQIMKKFKAFTVKLISTSSKDKDNTTAQLRNVESLNKANSMKTRNSSPLVVPEHNATIYINQIEISRNTKQELRKAANSPDIRNYFQKKYVWTNSTIENIDWFVHSKALQNMKGKSKKFITQFIHEWLPLNAHPGTNNHNNAKLCPVCTCHNETHHHFVTCCSTKSTNNWNAVTTSLHKHLVTTKTDPILTELLLQAITMWKDTPKPPLPPNLPPNYHPLFRKQSSIGWNQVLKGRLSTEWIYMQDIYTSKHCKRDFIQNERWAVSLLSHLWNQLYHHIWINRCNELHKIESQEAESFLKTSYIQRVHDLFNQKYLLEQEDQALFDQPVENITSLPFQSIKNWIKRNELFVRHSKHRAIQKLKSTIKPISTFFPVIHKCRTKTKSHKKHKVQKVAKPTTKAKHNNHNITAVTQNRSILLLPRFHSSTTRNSSTIDSTSYFEPP